MGYDSTSESSFSKFHIAEKRGIMIPPVYRIYSEKPCQQVNIFVLRNKTSRRSYADEKSKGYGSWGRSYQ